MDPAVAFRVREHEHPDLAVRVNFGVLTGRHVTPAEIDDLAHELQTIVPSFEIVAEERHEFGDDMEVSLHQVMIEVADADDDIAMDVVAIAERWARACFEARHLDVTEL